MTFIWSLIALISLFVPGALAYNLVFGKAKILHFGPVGVGLVAVYCAYVTFGATGSLGLGLLAGIAGALALSFLFARFSLRMDGDAFGLLTLAVHLALYNIVLNWDSVTGGTRGIINIPRFSFMETPASFALGSLAIVVCAVVCFLLLDRSTFGRQLQALSEYEYSAATMGISRTWVHTLAFLIAGVAAAIGNFFYVQYLHLAHPSNYTFPFMVQLVMIVVAGRPGSVLGVTASTALLVGLQEAIRFLPIPADVVGPVRLLVFGGILFAVVCWRRDVLFPQPRRV